MKRYFPFSHSEIGASHVAAGKPCQDASVHYEDDLMSVVAVADGHGSDSYFRSDRGAQIAVDVALSVAKIYLAEVLGDAGKVESLIRDTENCQEAFFDGMKKNILEAWRCAVRLDAQENPFSEAELSLVKRKYLVRYEQENNVDWAYGTTLILAVVTEHFWFSLQIGDGNCVEYYDGEQFVESTPNDLNCQGEATTSLCQYNAYDSMRHYFSTKIPSMVFVHSDGIDDSLLSEDIRQDEYQTWAAVFVQGTDTGASYITERRVPFIAQNWKKDDTSVAGIIDTENMESISKYMYRLRVEGKLKRDYADAVAKKQSLITNCESLKKTIAELEEKSVRAKQEYDYLREKAQIYTTEQKMLRELIEKNKAFLERRMDELNQCEERIRQLDEKMQAAVRQGNKLVSDNKRDREIINTNKNFLERRQGELTAVENRLADLSKAMIERGLWPGNPPETQEDGEFVPEIGKISSAELTRDQTASEKEGHGTQEVIASEETLPSENTSSLDLPADDPD